MDKYFKYLLNNFILLMLTSLHPIYTKTPEKVDLRLTEGRSPNQGRIEIRRNSTESWRPICDNDFYEDEAQVVCRQLGYRHSRLERNVYVSRVSDFVLDKLNCNGDEENIMDCRHSKWGYHNCQVKNNYYAGVCCSNSSEFGVLHGSIFESHCKANWTDTQKYCHLRNSSVLSLAEYISHNVTIMTTSKQDGPRWTDSFMSPWIWSNGCFTMTASNNRSYYTVDTITNISPQACLQICGITSDTIFAISNFTCRCLSGDWLSSVSITSPSNCSVRCQGDKRQYCGDVEGLQWNVFSVASQDDLFSQVTSPQTGSQCAVLINTDANLANRKLHSAECDENNGYICSELKSNGEIGNPVIEESLSLLRARHKCRTYSDNMWLTGKQIIETKSLYSKKSNIWVDITRTLTPKIHNAGHKDMSDTENPTWCQAFLQTNTTNSSVHITYCQERYSYYCIDRSVNPSKPTDDEYDYIYKDQSSTEDEHPIISPKNETIKTSDDKNTDNELIHIIAISCAIVLFILLVVLIVMICWRRSSKKKQSAIVNHSRTPNTACSEDRTNETELINHYETIPDNSQTVNENPYDQIKDPPQNIYNEPNEPHTHNHTADGASNKVTTDTGHDIENRESLKMKYSYTFPKDLIHLHASEHSDIKRSKSDTLDPKYMYPYDSLEKFDTCQEQIELLDKPCEDPNS